MSALIKICGIKTPDALAAAASAGATHVGFVFEQRSPRAVSPSQAADLAKDAPPTLKTVALVVDAKDDDLAAILRVFRPGLWQLHGAEDPQRVAHISARFAIPVIKVIGVAGTEDMRVARSYQTNADFLFFDTKPPKGDAQTLPGGNGRVFDWALLKGQRFAKPWLLSGGLTPENVATAIQTTRPHGVDVSSGVESSRGIKDNMLITKFCTAAASAFASEAVA